MRRRHRDQVQILGDGTVKIALTLGMFAVVDEADLPLVANRLWYAQKGRNGVFYAAHKSGDGHLLMHRVIVGAGEKTEVDHGDGDGLNNRRFNLSVGGRQENSRNLGARKNSPFGILGVTQHRKTMRYIARIMIDGKSIHLGYFATLHEAAQARATAEADMIGVHPRRREQLEKAAANG